MDNPKEELLALRQYWLHTQQPALPDASAESSRPSLGALMAQRVAELSYRHEILKQKLQGDQKG